MGLGKTKAEVTDTLRDGFSVGASESWSLRVQVARLLAPWDAARLRVTKEELAKADARASQ
eukprot:9898624-Karenia_brevis.AAC.1